jgi:hypothetical protein
VGSKPPTLEATPHSWYAAIMGRHIPVKTAETPPWAAELTIRERAFVDQFIIDLNGAAAAQRANVGGKNPKSAGQIASKMRKRPQVAAAISAALAEKHGIAVTAIRVGIRRRGVCAS